jgi:hypothetical protein
MKVFDLDYLDSVSQENSVILSGGTTITSVASASSFSYSSSGIAVSDATGYGFATGNNTYTLATGQTITWPGIAFSRTQVYSYASK